MPKNKSIKTPPIDPNANPKNSPTVLRIVPPIVPVSPEATPPSTPPKAIDPNDPDKTKENCMALHLEPYY